MPTDIWTHFYNRCPQDYERLISPEDYQGNLLRAIQEIIPPGPLQVVELGAGTGRLTALLSPHTTRIIALDRAPAMLALAREKLHRRQVANCHLALADNRFVPLRSNWADLALEGWSFLHLKVWHPETWLHEINLALQEMQRVLKPGGIMLVIETLGTGHKAPHVPELFVPFFDQLESAWHFQRTWTRSDYRFDSHLEAESILPRAFGQEVLDALEDTLQGYILPECTGLWWRYK